MAHDLAALLGPDGVVRRSDLAGRVDRHTVARWLAQERLLQPHPGVLALPERFEQWRTRAVAGLLATRGAVSHRSALAVWRLAPKEGVMHVSVPVGRHALRSPGLLVHRVQRLDTERVGGLPVTRLPRSLVDTWDWPSVRAAERGRSSWRVAQSSPRCGIGAWAPGNYVPRSRRGGAAPALRSP